MTTAPNPAAAAPPPAPTAKRSAVVFYSYPKLIFVWPLIVAGFVLWPFAPADSTHLEGLAWTYITVSYIVFLALGIDIERNVAFFLVVAFLALLFLGMYLSTFESFTLIGDVYRWFAGLDVQYNRSFGLVVSILLSVPFMLMFVWVRINDKWRITHNEFEHHAWGRADDSLARGAKRVRSTYPDLLELLLCGSGTLIVYSATGRAELRRIPHVPMLPVLRRRIDALLESVAVTSAAERLQEEAMLIEEEGGAAVGDESEESAVDNDRDRL